MRPLTAFPTVFALFLALAPLASADELELTGGGRVEGILASETPDSLEFQTAEGVFITLARAGVSRLLLADEAGRQAIRERWRAESRTLEEEARRAEELDRSQREMGLVWKYGRWMTPEELEAWELEEGLRLEERRIEADREVSRAALAAAVPMRPAPAPAFCCLVRAAQPIRRDAEEERGDAPPRSLYLEITTRIFNQLHTASPALAR